MELLATNDDSEFGKIKLEVYEKRFLSAAFGVSYLKCKCSERTGSECILAIFGEVKQSCQKDLFLYIKAEFTCRPYSAYSPRYS